MKAADEAACTAGSPRCLRLHTRGKGGGGLRVGQCVRPLLARWGRRPGAGGAPSSTRGVCSRPPRRRWPWGWTAPARACAPRPLAPPSEPASAPRAAARARSAARGGRGRRATTRRPRPPRRRPTTTRGAAAAARPPRPPVRPTRPRRPRPRCRRAAAPPAGRRHLLERRLHRAALHRPASSAPPRPWRARGPQPARRAARPPGPAVRQRALVRLLLLARAPQLQLHRRRELAGRPSAASFSACALRIASPSASSGQLRRRGLALPLRRAGRLRQLLHTARGRELLPDQAGACRALPTGRSADAAVSTPATAPARWAGPRAGRRPQLGEGPSAAAAAELIQRGASSGGAASGRREQLRGRDGELLLSEQQLARRHRGLSLGGGRMLLDGRVGEARPGCEGGPSWRAASGQPGTRRARGVQVQDGGSPRPRPA